MTRYTNIGATLSLCETMRYRLWRHWDDSLPTVVWIMLNPSWGDAERDDNTIKKVVEFSKLWGFGGVEIVNLFAYRTHAPAILKQQRYPGSDDLNDTYIRAVVKNHGRVVCAWGGNAYCEAGKRAIQRVKDVVNRLQENVCIETWALKVGANGMPWHPLYVPYKTERVHFNLWEDEL